MKTEITTISGRTVYLDFLCKTNDGKLYNIEFQLKSPKVDDLTRFYDYNIIANVRYDKITETVIVNFRTRKSGCKQTKIGESIEFHSKYFNLGDIDYEKILNNIEEKVKNNYYLTSSEEISLMLMSLLPKYKNKPELLKRIYEVSKKRECLNVKKYEIITGVIQLEIEKFVPENEQKEFKKEIDMTPETEALFREVFEHTEKKWAQLEKDEARKEGRKEGIEEGKKEGIKEGIKEGRKEGIKEVAKNLKNIMTDLEISEITGLSISEIEKL